MDAAVTASNPAETQRAATQPAYDRLVLPSATLAASVALDIAMFQGAPPAPCGSVLGKFVELVGEQVRVLAMNGAGQQQNSDESYRRAA